ncbi:conserved hypothetical protein [Leishmania major strain Friedlin]|uniref:Uncharacterized protein n=1 Tax=Leishmania major TaxID=5664 RepID=Q4QID3_LEIMA|nr:conserved hypothetical protein [Leishmania major strain Friedlin]CAJ02215.2 conserved hypothetical protein [Leishmania major strain Friedlin]|eukprot:XP_001681065.2 conserved hypothetical protein [Leishmania major strain Friedlin]
MRIRTADNTNAPPPNPHLPPLLPYHASSALLFAVVFTAPPFHVVRRCHRGLCCSRRGLPPPAAAGALRVPPCCRDCICVALSRYPHVRAHIVGARADLRAAILFVFLPHLSFQLDCPRSIVLCDDVSTPSLPPQRAAPSATMSTTTTTTQYTRSAILAWANDVLETSYATFQNIPSYEVGLLLYGIFHGCPSRGDATANRRGDTTDAAAAATATSSVSVPLLSAAELHRHHERHHETCMRYLQLLQFPSMPPSTAPTNPAAVVLSGTAEASAPSPGSTPASLLPPLPDGHSGATSAVAQKRNAEHVLAMICALSAEEAELSRAEASETRTSGGGHTASVVLLLGPSMTPAAWLAGSAFVEELKLWRWVRLMAERHRRSARAIRRAICAYLQHEVGVAAVAPAPAKDSQTGTASCVQSRGASPAPRSPVVMMEMSDVAEVELGDARGGLLPGKSTRAFAEDESGDTVLQEMKRMRPEMLPSTSPVPVHAVAAATTARPATSSVTPLVDSVSPVHALLSPIKEVAAAGGARTDGCSATGLSWTTSSSSVHAASEATITPYVAQATELQSALRTAQAALHKELALHRAQQQQCPLTLPTSTSGSTSERSSGGDVSDDAGAMHKVAPLLAPATNVCDALEASCRQRMVNTVCAKTLGDRGDSSPLSPVPDTLTCDVCPSIMAHAIQCNLAAIDDLEDVRARAIAACLRKDSVALLAALQNIV